MNSFKRMITVLTTLIFFAGCARSNNDSTPPSRIETPAATSKPPLEGLTKTNCVRVLYDRHADPRWELGKPFATYLVNLLGHFPEFQRHMSAIEDYVPGELDLCGVNIYLGTTYDNAIPQAFLDDFKTTTSQVAWLGYNAWKLGPSLTSIFGVSLNAIEPFTVLDSVNLVDGKPSFYQDVQYKGEVFAKYGEWGKHSYDATTFFSAFEVAHYNYDLTKVADVTDHQIMATIQHRFTKDSIPWAIQSKNRFLIAEVPLSFVYTGDRYLVFADMLFDILKAAPRHNSKPAVVRLEDVHSETDIDALVRARTIMKQNGVTPHMAIIPIFSNPLNANEVYLGQGERPMTMNTAFMAELANYKADGTEFIWHGITHQLNNTLNPWETTSGSDYEFWDFSAEAVNYGLNALIGRPVPGESPQSLIARFKKGADVLDAADVHPKVWLTPHYHGSSMSNYFFGQVFEWNIGRVVYYMNSMQGLDLNVSSPDVKFPKTDAAAWAAREVYLQNLKVSQDTTQYGQFFPYEIYGDVYGQRLFPENLGNVEKELNVQVIETRTVPQMLADAKRNLVLRDVWGSAFYHPYYLQDPYWTATSTVTNNDLNDLIVGLKTLGYNFVNLGTMSATLTDRAKAVWIH